MKPGVPRVLLVDVPPRDAERIVEMLARLGVDALSIEGHEPLDEEPIQIGVVRIDPRGCTAHLDGRELSLTAKEFGVLLSLARRAGAFVTRDDLMAEAWGRSMNGSTRTVDIHIRRVRQKLGVWGQAIETRVRVGYRLVPERLVAVPGPS